MQLTAILIALYFNVQGLQKIGVLHAALGIPKGGQLRRADKTEPAISMVHISKQMSFVMQLIPPL